MTLIATGLVCGNGSKPRVHSQGSLVRLEEDNARGVRAYKGGTYESRVLTPESSTKIHPDGSCSGVLLRVTEPDLSAWFRL